MIPIMLIPAHANDLSSPSKWLHLGLQDSPMEDFLSAVEDVLGQVTKPVRADRWGAFWATQSIEGQVRAVGLCSYKKEPNDLGGGGDRVLHVSAPRWLRHRYGHGSRAHGSRLAPCSLRHRPHAARQERIVQQHPVYGLSDRPGAGGAPGSAPVSGRFRFARTRRATSDHSSGATGGCGGEFLSTCNANHAPRFEAGL